MGKVVDCSVTPLKNFIQFVKAVKDEQINLCVCTCFCTREDTRAAIVVVWASSRSDLSPGCAIPDIIDVIAHSRKSDPENTQLGWE